MESNELLIGICKEQLDTPILLIDLDVMESNISRMADYFLGVDAELRPHTKTHKTPILAHKQMGLVSDAFDMPGLEQLSGESAIGHVRYSTTGSSVLFNAQPFVVHHRQKSYAVAHNGNLVNAHTLKNSLEEAGSIFQTTMDSEVFLHLFVKNLKYGFEQALIESVSNLKGAFSFVMLTSRGEVIGIKDPFGFRPLVNHGNRADPR